MGSCRDVPLERTLLISSTLDCFFSIVFRAASFLDSNMRVPAASSIIPRISGGFMFRTLVMRPCMIRKCGLFTFSCTEWKRFCTRVAVAVCPLMRYLLRPPMAICPNGRQHPRPEERRQWINKRINNRNMERKIVR